MDFAIYTTRNGTIGRSVKDANQATPLDVLGPSYQDKPEKLQDALNYTGMLLTTTNDNPDFVLKGFYRFGELVSPYDMNFTDIENNTRLKISRPEAIKLYESYLKEYL